MSGELVIEVRCEELPASYIRPALEGLKAGVLSLLKGVSIGSVRLFSTPRRLAVVIEDVAEARPRVEKVVTGPPLKAAQRNGEWTRAAQGFARGKGLTVDDLTIVEGPRGLVVAARVSTGGERTADLLAAGMDKVLRNLPAKKSMRWGSSDVRFARPLHQLIVVLSGEHIALVAANLTSSHEVVGHRRASGGVCSVATAEQYLSALRDRWVLADRDERRQVIRTGLDRAARESAVTLRLDEALLEEVVDLVEWPVVVTCRFQEDLLELPDRLLEESMRVHQRTFPTFVDGGLSNVVLIVSNNPQGDAPLIAEGNRRVLAARFLDAEFFLGEDRKVSLAKHGEKLAGMRWVRKLGTMSEKQSRVADLARLLAPRLGADPVLAQAAGALCKADLCSQMVTEFPKLQGHMGRLYALAEGQDPTVSQAIEDHYLPRHAQDALPQSGVGVAVALADRLDTLAGCFRIGLVPKGSNDPQALRRAAIGVLLLVLERADDGSLGELFELALAPTAHVKGASTLDARDQLVSFSLGRLRALLIGAGHRTDVVDAVLAVGGDHPRRIRSAVEALSGLAGSAEFGDLMVAFKRVLNITREHTDTGYDRALFQDPAEHALADGADRAAKFVSDAMATFHPLPGSS
jgi:glycyl-tRNA synthetase beta chain